MFNSFYISTEHKIRVYAHTVCNVRSECEFSYVNIEILAVSLCLIFKSRKFNKSKNVCTQHNYGIPALLQIEGIQR